MLGMMKIMTQNQVIQNQPDTAGNPVKQKCVRPVVNKTAVTFEGKPLYLLVEKKKPYSEDCFEW